MKKDVFISYSSKEADAANMVRAALEKNGIGVWMAPESIPGGSDYVKEIPAAIRECEVFILMLSDTAQQSIWISSELERAFKSEKIILPFAIENCDLNDDFDFLLSRCQRILAYEGENAAIETLVRRVKTILKMDDTVIKRQEFSNGDVYEGEFIDGKRTGKGTYHFVNGDVYIGDFVDGQISGKGKITFVDGTVYEGEFVNGTCMGYGTFSFPNGDVYEGEVVHGKLSGTGKFTWAEGSFYEGDFIEGRGTGTGVLIYTNGNRYEGAFVDGKMVGKGKFTWANGDVYEGDFIDGKGTGYGKFTWANGTYYEGEFVSGKRCGQGTYYGKEIIRKGIWNENAILNGFDYDKKGNIICEYVNGEKK